MARKGPPPAFTPTEHEIKEVEALAGLGLTKYLIQNYFGHSQIVWLKAEKRNSELGKAFRRGQARAIAKVSRKLFQAIEDGSVESAKFYLRTRGGWSEKYNPEHDCNISDPEINISVNDPIEASKIYQSIMKGGKK